MKHRNYFGTLPADLTTVIADNNNDYDNQWPIKNGFVHVPSEAHWLDDYLHELVVFPNGRYDDQVDSTAQALAWGKQRSSADGWLGFYRMEGQKNSFRR